MKLYAWYYRYIRRDPIYAGLIDGFYEKTVPEYYALIARREDYRNRWFKVWRGAEVEGRQGDQGVDFILTVPNGLPAVPHGGMRHGWKACGYTFLFNLVCSTPPTWKPLIVPRKKLDYSAGVMPITHVDGTTDALPSSFHPRNAIERTNYRMYDAKAMDGLPVGVQVIGRRLEEEHVLEGMKLIERLMREVGAGYVGLSV